MSEQRTSLADYPYRSGVLYASVRAAAGAVRRAIVAIDRDDPVTAAQALRHALDLLEPRLSEIDEVDRDRLAILASGRAE